MRRYHGDDVEFLRKLHEFLHLFVEVAGPDVLDVSLWHAEDLIGAGQLVALGVPLGLGFPIILLHFEIIMTLVEIGLDKYSDWGWLKYCRSGGGRKCVGKLRW